MEAQKTLNCGKLLGIYFYNVSEKHQVAIWVVRYISLQTRSTCSVFVVCRLSKNDLIQMPLQEPIPKPYSVNVNFMLWELQLRLKQPILQKVYLLKNSILFFHLDSPHILADVEIANVSVPCLDTHVAGAFLCIQGKQAMCKPNESPASKTQDFFYKDMVNDISVYDLSIFLKTKHGLYTYTSTDCCESKKQKHNELEITDIFKTEILSLSLGTENHIEVCLPKCEFQILWVNLESVWNGCLAEFFRALYCKLYKVFDGLHPMLGYVFPAASPCPTFFNPEFIGFPFVYIQYGSPQKLSMKCLSYPTRGHILTHWPELSSSITRDFLLAPDLQLPKLPEAASSLTWPIWTQELNSSMCFGEENKIYVTSPHTIITINFHRLLCDALFKEEVPLQILQEIAILGSDHIKKAITDVYSFIIASLMQWGKSQSFIWTAISGCSMVFRTFSKIENWVSANLMIFIGIHIFIVSGVSCTFPQWP
ncbi:helicase/primase [Harp seal herpesvirus]|uniref:Helicase/primase n=1 Tax=phocid gammaherpesvirus 3 TaxID=2560643 RepID=A0A0R5ZAL6_9GAMA|nr:helicase/primase [Harp seal herpesvirus]AJG42964.1 helicase/primase [Harp seal herpesvirus]